MNFIVGIDLLLIFANSVALLSLDICNYKLGM